MLQEVYTVVYQLYNGMILVESFVVTVALSDENLGNTEPESSPGSHNLQLIHNSLWSFCITCKPLVHG